MAKSKVAYIITKKSDLHYNGKTAARGETVTDLPGESITWLLADGFIAPAPNTPTENAPEASETPSEPVSDETNGGN